MNSIVQETCLPIRARASQQSYISKTVARKCRTSAVSHLALELSPLLASCIFDRSGELNESVPSTSGRSTSDVSYVQFPARQGAEPGSNQRYPMVRVRLNVHYRVHSRQMLCIGGSQLPFGWSFLSIAKVPLTWNPGDVWSTEVGALLTLNNIAIALSIAMHCS